MEESEQQKKKSSKKKKTKKKKTKKLESSSNSDINFPSIENFQNLKTFLNQSPPQPGSQWIDDIFPPNNTSISNSQKFTDLFESEDNDIDLSEIEWKRISEIYEEPQLFSGEINTKKIINGKINSSYFISAISAICDYPGLIKNIFINEKYNPDGFYTLILFIDGEFQIVYIDDFIPCLKGTNIPYFLKINNYSIWPLLLEKGWAKVNTSYQNALSGWPNDIFKTFTGLSCEELIHNQKDQEYIWKIIKIAKENNGIICASTKNEENINDTGLIPGISYSLINALEIRDEKNENIFLIKLRYDLGNSEWNGDWNKDSENWNEFIREQIPKEILELNEGEFFIELKDFINYFSRTDICYIICDGYKSTFDFNKLSDLIYPHVFNLYLEEETIISISAIEKNWRFHKELRNISHPTSIIIAEYDPDEKNLKYISCSYESYEDTEKTRVLNKGYYLVWVYKSSQSEKPMPESMKIRIISGKEIKLKYIGIDNTLDIIEYIIYQGVKLYKKEKIIEGEIFYDISNDFKNSGLGYRLIINNRKDVMQNWEIDIKDNKDYYLLPENPKENLKNIEVNPNDYECIVFIRNKKYGNFRLNLSNVIKQYNCDESQKREKERKNLEDFCLKNINTEEKINWDKTASFESITKIIVNPEINYEKIFFEKNKTNNMINIDLNDILKLPPLKGSNRLGLIKLETEDGIYLGEGDYAIPHGRGIYAFKNSDQVWVGYFENGKKGNFGKFYDKGKLIYEGEYLNGEKNGKGIYYYEEGMKYEGEFVKNKKEGKGTFYWDENTKWEGNWVNDKMYGEGLYKDEDDEYMIDFGDKINEKNKIIEIKEEV